MQQCTNSNRVMDAGNHLKNKANTKSLMSRGNIMQKTFFLFAVFCLSVASIFAQDVITLKNGDDIQALVQEIGEVEIKYKKFENFNGPNYTLKKSEVFMIRYANGSKDVFPDNPPPPPSVCSKIIECDAKQLESIFSIGLELITNYQEVSMVFSKIAVPLWASGFQPIWPSSRRLR